MNIATKALIRVGLTRVTPQGRLHVPIQFAPLWMWKRPLVSIRLCGLFGVFRNKWVNPRVPGRFLPRRWGFHICGLIEIGDRG